MMTYSLSVTPQISLKLVRDLFDLCLNVCQLLSGSGNYMMFWHCLINIKC